VTPCTHCGIPPKNGRLPRGLCQTCAVKLRLNGTYDQHVGPFVFAIVPGSRRPSAFGYMAVNTNLGTMPEHRAVMTEKLGRALIGEENVHHINGMRDDNSPENLELWSTSQPAGQRVSDKIAWARAFLKTYDSMSR